MSNNSGFLFTSESVTEGHPDKIADQISDAVLDAVLTQDPTSRVACETLITTGLVVMAGEITTKAHVDYGKVARETIRSIGYTRGKFGFDCDTCSVLSAIDRQSPDIAMGVDTGGAGDQGLMFGFACNETPELMPLPIQLAHLLARRLSEVRKSGDLPYLRPDGKSQVTIEYRDGRPFRASAIVISSQHDAEVKNEKLRAEIEEKVIRSTVSSELLDNDTKIHINPTGRFVTGGPQGDAGLTGRKIGRISENALANLVRDNFDLTPRGIMEELNLRRPVYHATAAYGHFGREEDGFTWEKSDRAESLRNAAGV